MASLLRSRWVRYNKFGEQAEIDEIAIQTAPCGNGWQVLGCIHSVVIMDLYSRIIVGWSIRKRMTQQLMCDALTLKLGKLIGRTFLGRSALRNNCLGYFNYLGALILLTVID